MVSKKVKEILITIELFNLQDCFGATNISLYVTISLTLWLAHVCYLKYRDVWSIL